MTYDLVTQETKNGQAVLLCSCCGASVRNTPTEAGRFLRRHPLKCAARKQFNKQLAQGVRCVEDDDNTDLGRVDVECV